jgi:hypothetical protein
MKRLGYLGVCALAALLTPTARSLAGAASTGRLLYGYASLLAPQRVAGRWAAPEPASVMNLRGFGGQHVAIGAFTLWAVRRRPDLVRPALLLNIGVEICDAVAGGFEVHERGRRDPVAAGGLLLPFANLAVWVTALRRTTTES